MTNGDHIPLWFDAITSLTLLKTHMPTWFVINSAAETVHDELLPALADALSIDENEDSYSRSGHPDSVPSRRIDNTLWRRGDARHSNAAGRRISHQWHSRQDSSPRSMSRVGPAGRLLSVKAEAPTMGKDTTTQSDYETVYDHARTLVGASLLGEAGVRCTALVLKQQQMQQRVSKHMMVGE